MSGRLVAAITITPPLVSTDAAQPRQIGARHEAGIEVRQETCVREDFARRVLEVGKRRVKAQAGQRAARRRVACLRLVPEGEERLPASRLDAGTRDGEHVLR